MKAWLSFIVSILYYTMCAHICPLQANQLTQRLQLPATYINNCCLFPPCQAPTDRIALCYIRVRRWGRFAWAPWLDALTLMTSSVLSCWNHYTYWNTNMRVLIPATYSVPTKAIFQWCEDIVGGDIILAGLHILKVKVKLFKVWVKVTVSVRVRDIVGMVGVWEKGLDNAARLGKSSQR